MWYLPLVQRYTLRQSYTYFHTNFSSPCFISSNPNAVRYLPRYRNLSTNHPPGYSLILQHHQILDKVETSRLFMSTNPLAEVEATS